MRLSRSRKPLVTLVSLAILTAAAVSGCGSSSSSSSKTANATDRAFVQEMIPHHMMAVQMAQSGVQQGQHPQLKTLAGSIVGDQNMEISEMTGIAKQLGVKPDSMPLNGQTTSTMMTDAKTLGMSMDEMGMTMDMTKLNGANPFDRMFISMMVPHHTGAVKMARAEIAKGENPQLKTLAQRIVGGQTREINEMSSWQSQWYGKSGTTSGGSGMSPMGGMHH